VPVYAVADGLLTCLSGWKNVVIVQHKDPPRPDEKLWDSATMICPSWRCHTE
jgi:hypothetical protein